MPVTLPYPSSDSVRYYGLVQLLAFLGAQHRGAKAI